MLFDGDKKEFSLLQFLLNLGICAIGAIVIGVTTVGPNFLEFVHDLFGMSFELPPIKQAKVAQLWVAIIGLVVFGIGLHFVGGRIARFVAFAVATFTVAFTGFVISGMGGP